MKALVKQAAEPGLHLLDVAKPSVGPTDVLIKVSTAAICGTDLHIYEWNDWAAQTIQTPRTIGHEFVGRIAQVGDRVTEFAVGTRVVGEGHIVCGTCRNCRAGHFHLCRSTVGIGIQRDGAFAEYIAIPTENVYAVPESVSDNVASILDPLGNAVHTTLSFDLVGEDVLITGAGPIGQMAAAVCRHVGARHVVITDLNATRLEVAKEMGATRSVNPTETSLESVMAELGMTEGFDVALEMSGSPHALGDILRTANHGCHVALLGLYEGITKVELNTAIFKGLTIKGIYGREIFDTWYKTVAMLESGLRVDPIISHRFTIDQYQEAFEALANGEASKVILTLE